MKDDPFLLREREVVSAGQSYAKTVYKKGMLCREKIRCQDAECDTSKVTVVKRKTA